MRKLNPLILIVLFLSSGMPSLNAQDNKLEIGFYNLENLFDTIDSKFTNDSEFTPEGRSAWNSERFNKKVRNLASVIASMGKAENLNAPSILGVCEVENRFVLEQLTGHNLLSGLNYEIVHTESPDKRGIDVALLYQKKHFTVTHYQAHKLFLSDPITGERIYTRDQLVVSGKLHEVPTTFIINHWPSRWGGKTVSEPKRLAAAQLTRHIIDSLYTVDSLQNIVIMGDFNDDPDNLSLLEQLSVKTSIDSLNEKDLYNGMYDLFQQGEGTLCYRGVWNLFDQIIVNGQLINNSKFVYKGVKVFSPDYLRQQEGRYKNYPFRTLAGPKYLGGYSDHFPVYMVLGF